MPDPTAMVIFGATGDLTSRKLMPALFSLAVENRLAPHFRVVGFSRTPWTDDDFRTEMRRAVEEHGRYTVSENEVIWENFARNFIYIPGDFAEVDSFRKLDTALSEQADEQGIPDNRLYYLAAPPQFFDDIVSNLGIVGMADPSDERWRRIIIEKPFGHDLQSAKHLNHMLHRVFREEQAYRIDHYLGKETVQNLLVLRFDNAIWEPIWNRNLVDHVQISVAESIGIEDRAAYYDQAGIIRDIFQNHIMQLLTLVAMEPPVAFEANAIRDEKVKVLRAMKPIPLERITHDTVRAQYGAGVIDGKRVPAYLREDDVPSQSRTATYAALKWHIDNWRWQGVPFYLRSGKRMPTRASEISIHFKRPPHMLFDPSSDLDGDLRPNVLAIRIQPDEGIAVRFEVKVPGQGMDRRSVTMDFRYGTSFGAASLPDAYERLLLDAMLGDPTLFARSDEIECAWDLIDPLLHAWHEDGIPPLETYEAGTWGPAAADRLLQRDDRQWRRL
jgi:glucose-6-phosphate 1-dehydrogenase